LPAGSRHNEFLSELVFIIILEKARLNAPRPAEASAKAGFAKASFVKKSPVNLGDFLIFTKNKMGISLILAKNQTKGLTKL